MSNTSFTKDVWEVITGVDDRGLARFLYDEAASNPLHVVVELLCLVYIVYLWRLKPHKPGSKPPGEEPTEQEKLQMIADWQPEPLDETDLPDELVAPTHQRVVIGQDETHLEIEGAGRCLDFGTFNYLRMATEPEVVRKTLDAIDQYGVGSCGPRGFYGTVQPHLVLEEQLGRVYGMDAIIYSFQYSTTSSILPAFSGRGDYLVVDKGVNMGILNGVFLSRSKIFWFDHNNLGSLEEQLKKVTAQQKKGKKLMRSWIVVEGVYRNYGDVCPLKEVMQLKDKYKFRIVVDDTCGTGALGKTGRGTCEELLGAEGAKAVDVYTGGLDAALGSTGGFCVGSRAIIDHQRLSSAGYVFSASLPPFAAVAATTALGLMLDQPERVARVRENAQTAREVLAAAAERSGCWALSNGVHSPVFHLRFPADTRVPRARQEAAFAAAVSDLQKQRIAVSRPQYTADEHFLPPASLRFVVSSGHGTADVAEAAQAVAGTVEAHVRRASE